MSSVPQDRRDQLSEMAVELEELRLRFDDRTGRLVEKCVGLGDWLARHRKYFSERGLDGPDYPRLPETSCCDIEYKKVYAKCQTLVTEAGKRPRFRRLVHLLERLGRRPMGGKAEG